MSAAAVEAVRWGFRIAFSRARIPGAPPNLAAGPPSTCESGVDELRREERDAEEDEHGADAHGQTRSCVVERPRPNSP